MKAAARIGRGNVASERIHREMSAMVTVLRCDENVLSVLIMIDKRGFDEAFQSNKLNHHEE